MNGVVESAIEVVDNTFRCLMIQGGAPDSDIPNALVHSNVIRNNTPTSANNGVRHDTEREGSWHEAAHQRSLGQGPTALPMLRLHLRGHYKVNEWISGRIYYTGDAVMRTSQKIVLLHALRLGSSARWASTGLSPWLRQLVHLSPWLRQFLHELWCTKRGPTWQLADNRGVYLHNTKQVNYATAKHFRISQAFIRGATDDGVVDFDKVGTHDNRADFFATALTKERLLQAPPEQHGSSGVPPPS